MIAASDNRFDFTSGDLCAGTPGRALQGGQSGNAAGVEFLPPLPAGGGMNDHRFHEAMAGVRDAVAAGFGVPRVLLGHERASLFPVVFPNFSLPVKSLKQRKINQINCIDGTQS